MMTTRLRKNHELEIAYFFAKLKDSPFIVIRTVDCRAHVAEGADDGVVAEVTGLVLFVACDVEHCKGMCHQAVRDDKAESVTDLIRCLYARRREDLEHRVLNILAADNFLKSTKEKICVQWRNRKFSGTHGDGSLGEWRELVAHRVRFAFTDVLGLMTADLRLKMN